MSEVTCVICPKGCTLSVDAENGTVSGNGCPRGVTYGLAEVTDPRRILTTTIRLKSLVSDSSTRESVMLPVRTELGIPKRLLFQAIKEINQVELLLPIHCGQIVLSNVCNTGINVVASRSLMG